MSCYLVGDGANVLHHEACFAGSGLLLVTSSIQSQL